jgi:hypothetical protein
VSVNAAHFLALANRDIGEPGLLGDLGAGLGELSLAQYSQKIAGIEANRDTLRQTRAKLSIRAVLCLNARLLALN